MGCGVLGVILQQQQGAGHGLPQGFSDGWRIQTIRLQQGLPPVLQKDAVSWPEAAAHLLEEWAYVCADLSQAWTCSS